MSYLVCHIQKFKNSDVKRLQIHNQRESDKSKNIDIDKSKSYLNIDLHNIGALIIISKSKILLSKVIRGLRLSVRML